MQKAQEIIKDGYKYCVGLDLEKFFDAVNHSPILTRAISNENLKRVHYLILTEYYEKLHPH